MNRDYTLTEKDARLDKLTPDERTQLMANKSHYNGDHLYTALRMAIPRLLESGEAWQQPSEHKPVILTADDVKSVLLQGEETHAIEYPRRMEADRLNKKVFTPLFNQIHQVLDKEMDNLARQAGFEQFDENGQGTGLRNYTAQGKPMTPAIKAQVAEYDRLYNASPIIRKGHKHLSGLLKIQESMLRALNQVMFRNMLDITNERMTRVDADGHPILTPQKYLEKIEQMDAEKKRIFEEPFTTCIETNGSDMAKIFHVDTGIADFVKQINDIGYRTGQSCSGLLADHPNYRYVQDSDTGLYVKGECINYNKQGSGTYLTFYKTYNNFNVNKPEQIDDIRDVAAKEGWIVEDTEIFGQPSVRLGLPYTYDGLGKREILHIANDITDRAYPGLKDTDFLQWLDYRNKEEKKVAQNHGGVVRWTDDMIKQRWQKLTHSLVQAQRERLGLNRISDVRVYLGGDGHRRIKCRIDGQDMLSEHFSDAAMTMLNKGVDIKILAARCYEDQLQAKQDRGLKR